MTNTVNRLRRVDVQTWASAGGTAYPNRVDVIPWDPYVSCPTEVKEGSGMGPSSPEPLPGTLGLVWSGGARLLGRPAVLLVPTLPPLSTDLYEALLPFPL